VKPKPRDEWRECWREVGVFRPDGGVPAWQSVRYYVRLTLYGWELRIEVTLDGINCIQTPELCPDTVGMCLWMTSPSMLTGPRANPWEGTGEG
jgi:hypothetical protein